MNTEKQEKLAEEVRLVYRHLYWAAGHAARVYDMIKPEDKPAIVIDPCQLNLFEITDNNNHEQ